MKARGWNRARLAKSHLEPFTRIGYAQGVTLLATSQDLWVVVCLIGVEITAKHPSLCALVHRSSTRPPSMASDVRKTSWPQYICKSDNILFALPWLLDPLSPLILPPSPFSLGATPNSCKNMSNYMSNTIVWHQQEASFIALFSMCLWIIMSLRRRVPQTKWKRHIHQPHKPGQLRHWGEGSKWDTHQSN